MHAAWFRRTFLRVLIFQEMKKWGPNFWGEPILQNLWIICSPLLYFNFKSFLDPNSSSFIRFQSFLHESGELFSGSRNFCQLKRGDLISRRNEFCRMSELFCPLLYFNLKSYMDPNSSFFSSFQSFLHESGVLFSESWNSCNLKSRDLISKGNQFWRMSELFSFPFCISILEVLWTQILRHSLNFSLFFMIHGYFSHSPELSQN